MNIIRFFQIVCPIATSSVLLAAINAIQGVQPTQFMLDVPVGPEHEPDCGYATAITHHLCGPSAVDDIYLAVKTLVELQSGAHIADQSWLVLDESEWRVLNVDGAIDLKQVHSLFDYDEAMAP